MHEAVPDRSDERDAERPSAARRWTGWFFFGVGLLATAATLLYPKQGPDAPGRTLPIDVFVRTVGGEELRFGSALGPVTLVHFFASWCAPCAVELPRLLAFVEAARPGLALLLVAVEDSPERAAELVPPGWREAIVLDPDWQVAHGFGTFKLPETHLLVRGRVVDHFIGAMDWQLPELQGRVLEAVASAGR